MYQNHPIGIMRRPHKLVVLCLLLHQLILIDHQTDRSILNSKSVPPTEVKLTEPSLFNIPVD